jgi:hypothetical protein
MQLIKEAKRALRAERVFHPAPLGHVIIYNIRCGSRPGEEGHINGYHHMSDISHLILIQCSVKRGN